MTIEKWASLQVKVRKVKPFRWAVSTLVMHTDNMMDE